MPRRKAEEPVENLQDSPEVENTSLPQPDAVMQEPKPKKQRFG
jgi:hypothetical protein